MLMHCMIARWQRDINRLPCPAMPNGVSASSTWLIPTVTNSVLLGLWCRFRSNSGSKRPAIARGDRRAYRAYSLQRQDGEFESWLQPTIAPSPCSAEPAFSADALSGICALADFPFGSPHG